MFVDYERRLRDQYQATYYSKTGNVVVTLFAINGKEARVFIKKVFKVSTLDDVDTLLIRPVSPNFDNELKIDEYRLQKGQEITINKLSELI